LRRWCARRQCRRRFHHGPWPMALRGNARALPSAAFVRAPASACDPRPLEFTTPGARFYVTAVRFYSHCSAILQSLQCDFTVTAVRFYSHCSAVLQSLQCDFTVTAVRFYSHCSAILRSLQCDFTVTAVRFYSHCSAILQSLQCGFTVTAVRFCGPFPDAVPRPLERDSTISSPTRCSGSAIPRPTAPWNSRRCMRGGGGEGGDATRRRIGTPPHAAKTGGAGVGAGMAYSPPPPSPPLPCA
jgi:hypothetical protein